VRNNQHIQFRLGRNHVHHIRELAFARRLDFSSDSHAFHAHLFHATTTVAHQAFIAKAYVQNSIKKVPSFNLPSIMKIMNFHKIYNIREPKKELMMNKSPMQTSECPFCAAEIPMHVKKCRHCGEWLKKPEQSQAPHDERETCHGCGKKIIPRIITGPPILHGQGGWTPVPKKSICPFCGTTHRKFPMTMGEKIGLAIFAIVGAVILLYFMPRW